MASGGLGFNPDRGNRYEYALNAAGTADSRTTTVASTPANADTITVDAFRYPNETMMPAPSLKCGTLPSVVTGAAGSFLAAAVGNIDNDATLDQWSIASYTRTTTNCDAEPNVVGGEPANEQDDVGAP